MTLIGTGGAPKIPTVKTPAALVAPPPTGPAATATVPSFNASLPSLPSTNFASTNAQAPALGLPAGLSSNPYSAQLSGDLTLQGQLQQLNDSNTTSLNQLLAQAQQKEVAYGAGLDPSSISSALYGGAAAPLQSALTDPTVAAAATGNTNSALASIQQQLTTANQSSLADLAGRGLLHSGAVLQHENDNSAAATSAQGTAQQNFLDYLNGLYSGYQNTLAGNVSSENSDVNDALNRIIAQIGAGVSGLPQTGSVLPDGVTAPSGNAPLPDGSVVYSLPDQTSLIGGENPTGAAIPVTSLNNLVPQINLPDFNNANLPYAAPAKANKTGASANKTQGIFSIH